MKQNTHETPIGLTPDAEATLDNTAAMAEMQKAFAQIEAMKQSQEICCVIDLLLLIFSRQ